MKEQDARSTVLLNSGATSIKAGKNHRTKEVSKGGDCVVIRYELKIPAIVTYRDKGIVDVQLRSGIKVTLKEDDFVRCFKVMKDISTIED